MKKMTVLVALAAGLQGISTNADSLRIDNATIMTMVAWVRFRLPIY